MNQNKRSKPISSERIRKKLIFLYESIYAMAVDKFLYLFNFFSVKSSCALVTREEMVISPRARSSCPGRNGNFLPGNECAWQFHGKNRFFTYINSNRNRFSEWPSMSGIEISSSRGLKKTLKLARGMKSLPPAGLRPLGG